MNKKEREICKFEMAKKENSIFLISLIVSEWGECCHLLALWRVQFILCKVFSYVQIIIFTKEVVFRLNITCKTIFTLPFKTF